MTPEQIVKIMAREARAVGAGWRHDWSEFDGRTLRDQMNALADWAERALADGGVPEFTEGSDFLKDTLAPRT